MTHFSRPVLKVSSWTLILVGSAFMGLATVDSAFAETDTAPTAGPPKAGDTPVVAPAKPDAAKPVAPKADPAKPAAAVKSEKSRSWKSAPAAKAYESSPPDPAEPPPAPGVDERNPGGVEHAPSPRQ